MNTKKYHILVALALLLSLVLVACEPAEEPTPVVPVETPIVPPVEETPPVVETPVVETPPATPEPVDTPEVTPPVETPEVRIEDRVQVIRASDLIGLNIVDQTGETVGQVSEVLVDMEGNFHYVLFDAGGFLGIGATTRAVPWDMVMVQPTDVGPGVTTTETLFTDDWELVYQGDRAAVEAAPEIDEAALDDDLVWDAQQLGLEPEFDGLMQLSQLQGRIGTYDVVNLQDENLGGINDLVIDLEEGRILYAAVGFGGVLGIAETTVAVPWQQLQYDPQNDEFVLDVDQETFQEEAPTLDYDDYEDPTDMTWDQEIRGFWQAR